MEMDKEQENIMLGRIYSRIIEMCLSFRVVGEDGRKIQRTQKINRTQHLIND